MNAITVPDPHLDVPTLLADAMVESGLLDALFDTLGKALREMPKKAAAWIGSECKTPNNSPAPNVSPAEPGLWNGVIFIESNEAAYWMLVKANPGKHQQAGQHSIPFAGREPHGGPRYDQRHEPFGTTGFRPDGFAHEPPPWEGDPWRR